MRRTSALFFNPKGFYANGMRPLNPGMKINLAPKSMQSSIASPVSNMPFDDEVLVSPEIISSRLLKFPMIMKGFYGRRTKHKQAMRKWSYWVMAKTSAYRWLRKEEQALQSRSNISAGLEQHGLQYKAWSHKRTKQNLHISQEITQKLAQNEPLAFRCMAELLRSDNYLVYEKNKEYLEERKAASVKSQAFFNRHAIQSPVPMRRRLPDPSWREIPYYQGRMSDKNFHPQHPIFLVDWKI
eukprot:TRINITY_DN13628_c0_g2_i1.p1 TRINITY_DN13628_c0_g2~~TRINITY_DN13628_c0_g2_i1.p1  ORF type:complete len:240 (+),score=26.53 TRINITY_DN13628_c0_g2_i1:49-768(+)